MAPDQNCPVLSSSQQLNITEALVYETKETYTTFYITTEDDVLYFGKSPKGKDNITLAEYQRLLHRVPDAEVFPEPPPNVEITVAPDDINKAVAYMKMPCIKCYEDWAGSSTGAEVQLAETMAMERISSSPHPNIVKYLGCRVRRGRITAFFIEKLEQNLEQFAATPAYQQIDKVVFMEAIESAVNHLHGMGLAHNDISSYNIMVKGGMPILIDFGSCRAFGERLDEGGTVGWAKDERSFRSEKEHDMYSLVKLREFLKLQC
ncbi:hypothetical protein NLG97_g7844 [Lecanicillium saksenae]|uniref:Uncharacterized protein n=1 Tax=Lecanicillium saksenae TaxID=468837 RepID=A0ACC1QMH7_9HYPO|nr:hypothetical protein NLG97_g7844 [Lecanicillium saksenae]